MNCFSITCNFFVGILLLIGLHESDCFASKDPATICKNECTYYRDRDVYFDPSGLIKKCLEQCFNSHCIDPCMAQNALFDPDRLYYSTYRPCVSQCMDTAT